MCCDVTDASTVADTVATAVDRTGALHAIVHNATSNRSSEPHRLETVDATLWEEHAAVSLRGAYHSARAGFEALHASQGTLVLMTSPAGIEGSHGLPLYGTVKGALRGFTKSLAREWAPPRHDRQHRVAPGLLPAMVNAIEKDPAMEERLSRRVPMGRVGDPETDVGPTVAFPVRARRPLRHRTDARRRRWPLPELVGLNL